MNSTLATTPSDNMNRVKISLLVMLTSFSIVGALGNSLVLFVYARKKDRQVSTYFILFMSVVDLITCSIVIPLTIYFEYVGHAIGDLDLLCKVYQFSLTSVVPLSALTMAAIAVDRYLCICHPFVKILDVNRARVISIILVLLASCFGVTAALIHGVQPPVEDCSHDNGGVALTTPSWSSTPTSSMTSLSPWQHTGRDVCSANYVLISCEAAWTYHKIYNAVYLYCLVHVMVLYSLVLRSIVARRLARTSAKAQTAKLVAQQRQIDNTPSAAANQKVRSDDATEQTANEVTAPNSKKISIRAGKNPSGIHKPVFSSDVMANIRMAAMLFVVAFVFIVAFLPACLMSMQLISEHVMVFYMYFAYNVANPIIYSFMNKNFRDDLRKLFC